MSSKFDDSANFSPAPGFDVRFMRAFSNGMAKTSDKRTIAEILGYESEKAVYKIIKGDQEMNFERLLRFREATGYSIDWLLYGDDAMPDKDGWIRIRNLISPIRISDIERVWRDKGRSMAFEDFLSEIFVQGYRARSGEISTSDISDESIERAITAWFRRIVREDSERSVTATDAFDLERAVSKYDDPQVVLEEWYRSEGWPIQELSVPAFSGWEKMTVEQKADELRSFIAVRRRQIERQNALPPKAP